MIRTVTNDIEKEELGITMCHEHFIVDLDRVRHDGISKIETVEEVEPEIQQMMALGVQAAVEVSTIDLGRDIRKLKQISQDTGLTIIAATGFYLTQYHPEWLKEASPEQIAQVYIRELTEGIDDTGIKAGIIAEIASSPDRFEGEEKKILQAAGIASRLTGAAVSTHTSHFTAVETIETLLAEGVDPDKIIIGHQDLIDDSAYHALLLEYGVNIAFDTCGKKAYMPDETRARNALKIIEAGYGGHLLFSNDISRRTYFTSHGKAGYLSVMKEIVPLLKQIGAKEEQIRRCLVDNPARILDNEWR